MSSPMMMSSGSAATIRLPPATATAAFPPSSFRQRGHSVSTLREFDHLSGSSFRSRARSPTRFDDPIPKKDAGHTPPSNSPSGWWNEWRDPPAKKENAPADHTEAWVETRQRVAQAAVAILGTAGEIAHETLALSVDWLALAPVPGLHVAAKMLLEIWDTVQMVDMSRIACLRLTERCAEILLSVREEVTEASRSVEEELAAPIAQLSKAFMKVQVFLQKQVRRPFLQRYLKRDEILRGISACDGALSDAMEMFSLSVQIRILKSVQAAEVSRKADNQVLMQSVAESRSALHASHRCGLGAELTGLPSSSSHPSLSTGDSTNTINQLHVPGLLDSPSILSSPSTMRPSQILPALRSLHSKQNHSDALHDTDDLRNLMRAAVQTSSDVEMLEVLQVGRDEMPEAMKTLQRAFETVSEGGEEALILEHSRMIVSAATRGDPRSSSTKEVKIKDTLHQEFIESGIDALRRMSKGGEASLPSWTITRYEVDCEEKIGIGFFSDVYKGSWRGRTVAIKVLAESTPRRLFVREVEIWKTLHHPNVLELYGASSASGDPPWFFVSPYEKNGSLVEYLKKVALDGASSSAAVGLGLMGLPRKRASTYPTGRRKPIERAGSEGDLYGKKVDGRSVGNECDPFRFVHEIASGMEYLHSRGVLHGDLKASNVLVDDDIHCIISDFGQSEMKSEAYRISGTPAPHGTLRWQSPELMAGQSQLTAEMDVYAFAISCIEILTMGRVPWPLMDDSAVRHFVLHEDQRPQIPFDRFNTPSLRELLRLCWHRDPSIRPPFSEIVGMIRQMRKNIGQNPDVAPSPHIPISQELSARPPSVISPDMRPNPLSGGTYASVVKSSLARSPPGSPQHTHCYATNEDSPPRTISHACHREDTVATGCTHMPEPVFYTPSASSSRSSIFTHTLASQSDEMLDRSDYEGYDSPPPVDEKVADMRNERRYRMLLDHEFHPSLTLPLWSPSRVTLCDVGYLNKSSGKFVTLFNSLDPDNSSNGLVKDMPSLKGYGHINSGCQRQEKRNVAQRGLDAFVGLLTFRNKGDGSVSKSVSRRYSFPLRSGHKAAYLCTEKTTYRYVENLDTPKKWFKANVDDIMEVYGAAHQIQKEDLYLVIGTLDASDYALFVSHSHPNGQAHFNVFSSTKSGQPWGTFTTDTESPPELGGPSYREPETGNASSSSKVSSDGGPRNTVLVSRLRFKPDALEPTSL